jgi:hypothetical protein
MTAQAGTLQTTTEARRAARGKRVFFRTLLVILKSTTSVVVFSLIFLFENYVHPLFLVFALLCTTGLVAGMMARRMLKAFHRVLQFLVALIALITSMIALNYYSGGVLGISHQTIYYAEIDPQAFLQVGVGFLAMLMALSAWRKPRRQRQTIEPQSPPRSFRSPEMQLEFEMDTPPERVRVTPARRAINWFSGQTSHPFVIGGSRRTPASPPRAGGISVQGSNNHRPRLRPGTRISTRRSTLILKGKKPVKFIGVEEHRCPYCLEIVVDNDPRGVEICPICHTYHHADCWDVTGVCQVPHANG